MKWMGWCGTAVVAVLLVLGPVPASAAAPTLRLTVDRHVVHSGQQLTVTARADTNCTWVLAWHGQRTVGHGRTASATFTAPTVTRATRLRVHARCFYEAPVPRPSTAPSPGGAAERLTVNVPPSRTATAVVTVLPAGGGAAPPGGGTLPPGDGLPDTGGPPRWLILAGLGSLLVGVGAVRSSRRPNENSP